MAVRLGINIASLMAQRQLNQSTEGVNKALERLSSGLRINRASDDAAGLAIASALRSDTRIYTQALRNIEDGISAISIAQSALQNLSSIIIRQRELAEQAANGTYSLKQRQALNDEGEALTREFNRIAASVEYNGISLLDPNTGEIRIQMGVGIENSLGFSITDGFERDVGNGTFSTTTGITALPGLSPIDSIIVDVNGDGNLDIVSAQSNNNTLGVFLGNGDGTFKAGISAQGNSQLMEIRPTDINGDGILDLITLGDDVDVVTVFLGNGDGTFKARRNYFSGDKPINLELGDFNEDGKLDVITFDQTSNSLSVLYGNGDGSFKSSQTIAIGLSPRTGRIGDFNLDGHLDVAVGNDSNDTINILLGNGNGTFSRGLTYQMGSFASIAGGMMQIADFNHDGVQDIVVGEGGDNSIGILFGRGDGTFNPRISFTTDSFEADDLTVGDMNGDGLDDIIAIDYGGGSARIYLGVGDGTFTLSSATSILTQNLDVTVGDLNGDGSPDLAYAIRSNNSVGITFTNATSVTSTEFLNLASRDGALAALETTSRTLDRLSQGIASLGASESRLLFSRDHLQVLRENYRAAESRIMDADIAQEAAELIRLKILQQMGSAILAQANLSPDIAIKLLAID